MLIPNRIDVSYFQKHFNSETLINFLLHLSGFKRRETPQKQVFGDSELQNEKLKEQTSPESLPLLADRNFLRKKFDGFRNPSFGNLSQNLFRKMRQVVHATLSLLKQKNLRQTINNFTKNPTSYAT